VTEVSVTDASARWSLGKFRGINCTQSALRTSRRPLRPAHNCSRCGGTHRRAPPAAPLGRKTSATAPKVAKAARMSSSDVCGARLPTKKRAPWVPVREPAEPPDAWLATDCGGWCKRRQGTTCNGAATISYRLRVLRVHKCRLRELLAYATGRNTLPRSCPFGAASRALTRSEPDRGRLPRRTDDCMMAPNDVVCRCAA